jgi:undecaprenyl-diphosphatase
LLLLALVLAFVGLAGVVFQGGTQQVDEQILRSMRRSDDLSRPIGPLWLQGAALDITALGSATVLGIVVFAIVGFLVLQGKSRTALFILLASTGGPLLNALLKEFFRRPRPEVVPHLREVLSLSFPSGHAMTSAAVYLTLGALLSRIAERRATKIYCMVFAMLVTFMVGLTRVYLGVHYPTDVLAGWLVGLSWAFVCWIVERAVERRTGIKAEQRKGA